MACTGPSLRTTKATITPLFYCERHRRFATCLAGWPPFFFFFSSRESLKDMTARAGSYAALVFEALYFAVALLVVVWLCIVPQALSPPVAVCGALNVIA